MKIKQITKSYYKGIVSNLHVKKNNNYFANGILVHNCYQDSLPEAKHADRYYLMDIAEALGALRVFEVALGGGEPTLHPDFIDILRDFRHNGVVPNFTTRNLQWLHDPVRRVAILQECGSFAFSTQEDKEIEKLAGILKTYDIPTDRVSLHYVLGLDGEWSLKHYLQIAHQHKLQVTLLGYKRTGRAKVSHPTKPGAYFNVIKELRSDSKLPTLAIDTVLAKEWADDLAGLVNPRLFYAHEGMYSGYIDAVNKTIAASSYVGEPITIAEVQCKEYHEVIKEAWMQIAPI